MTEDNTPFILLTLHSDSDNRDSPKVLLRKSQILAVETYLIARGFKWLDDPGNVTEPKSRVYYSGDKKFLVREKVEEIMKMIDGQIYGDCKHEESWFGKDFA